VNADRAEIGRFVNALFLHADRNSYVSLRAFRDDGDGVWRYEEWSTVRIADTLDGVIAAAFRFADACAVAPEPVCFAPPVATFNNPNKADQASLANGLVISAELDAAPQAARQKLEAVLGPPTIAMTSGGRWTDPATGAGEDKLHLHWRLAPPTRNKIEHDFLRECNRLVCKLAGGDPTAITLVHPMRWAGSLHKKATPRLARIIAFNPVVEITFADALNKLRAALAATPRNAEAELAPRNAEAELAPRNAEAELTPRNAEAELTPHQSSEPQADVLDVCAALAVIPNDDVDWDRWNTIGMATWRATGGSAAGCAAFVAWSSKSKKFDLAATHARWAHYRTSPPNQIGAGTLFHLARQARADFVKPSSGHDRSAPPGAPSALVPSNAEPPWPEMDGEAFHGLAGHIVEAIAPHTEADPVAILASFVTAFGCAFGRASYCWVGDTQHYPNLFVTICGTTSKGRKGTSYDPIEKLLGLADPSFVDGCVQSGLSSGEGVIHAVHDEIRVREKVPGDRGKPPVYVEVVKYPNVTDKRLFIIEQEFAGALSVMQRHGNSLSPVLRLGWDGRRLQTITKTNPESATGAHLSILAHITIAELHRMLDQVHLANGFANRFCFLLARRSRPLPFPGQLDPTIAEQFGQQIQNVLTNEDLRRREIEFGPEARAMWIAEYPDLSAEKPGLYGSITARAEAQTLRLTMIYALLDQTHTIQPEHLRAALAFWRYCEASAKYIFGDALGDPIADTILIALRQQGSDGLNRTEISSIFARNKSAAELSDALQTLMKHGKARMDKRRRSPQGGTTPEVWVAC
jgi:hypothetical protein